MRVLSHPRESAAGDILRRRDKESGALRMAVERERERGRKEEGGKREWN